MGLRHPAFVFEDKIKHPEIAVVYSDCCKLKKAPQFIMHTNLHTHTHLCAAKNGTPRYFHSLPPNAVLSFVTALCNDAPKKKITLDMNK